MSSEPIGHKPYNLVEARKFKGKDLVMHQQEAYKELENWFNRSDSKHGGILSLPTGGGKTLTALRFLAAGPLSNGYKVLWLAHTHHLLDQAFQELGDNVSSVQGQLTELLVRVISGMPGHFSASSIKPSDHVVIGTIQSLSRALEDRVNGFLNFLASANGQLVVVFDEAHHAAASSYRRFIRKLQEKYPKMWLLGLTATPTRATESGTKVLATIFPDGIIYSVSLSRLISENILAKPIFRSHSTEYDVEPLDPKQYEKLRDSFQDLPEEIIDKLANSEERNRAIVSAYVEKRSEYGKTIIFADRWWQCNRIVESLKKYGVKADYVYSHIEHDPGSVEARNKRTGDHNSKALHDFKDGKIEVLVNVRMLTEGTDVPNAQTVFLTRQTTSQILMTQMVGRALRGPRFGGTKEAFIVGFIDKWQNIIQWADPRLLIEDGPLPEEVKHAYARRIIEWVSIQRIQDLAQQLNTGFLVNSRPYLQQIPIGWYVTHYTAPISGNGESEDHDSVRTMIMVFEGDRAGYESFFSKVTPEHVQAFDDDQLTFDTCNETHQEYLDAWRKEHFSDIAPQTEGSIDGYLFHIARHMAQNQAKPDYFLFDIRDNHDLDRIAEDAINKALGPLDKDEFLRAEYVRQDRYWHVLYPNYDYFKSQYDGCENRIVRLRKTGNGIATPVSISTSEIPPDREPSEEIKRQVKSRDNNRCLCCGETSPRMLQIDHITPYHINPNNDIRNLQTLCRICNGKIKGINEWNFTTPRTTLSAPTLNPHIIPTSVDKRSSPRERGERFIRRSINVFYGCGAVEKVITPKPTRSWRVMLYAGNNPNWLKDYLPKVILAMRDIFPNFETIEVAAPGFESIISNG